MPAGALFVVEMRLNLLWVALLAVTCLSGQGCRDRDAKPLETRAPAASCAALKAKFSTLYADPGSASCQGDDLCDWGPSINDAEPMCGGPLNTQAEGRLTAIIKAYEQAGCGRRSECEFEKGATMCREGQCVWMSVKELRDLEP